MAHTNGISHARNEQTVSYAIQAIIRRGRIGMREINGSLLKARLRGKTGRNHQPPSELTVDFTGSDFNDPKTEFYLEKIEEESANVFRYTINGDNYYLGVNKPGKVTLQKLVHVPKHNKYFFHIGRIGPEIEAPFTFKSLKTGEFLHCDEKGKAFMEKATSNGEPKDREAWFTLISCKHTNGHCVEIREEVDGNSEDLTRGTELVVYVTTV